uniref:Formyl transferase domain protein n=1 Tax=Geobacter sp. (strain M21) TaxID=443144 RepID=C6E0L4_GEOSM
MNIILCGYHWTGCKALDLLDKQGHNIFVFTHESPYYVPSLSALCIDRNIPFSYENISKAKLPFVPDVICSVYYRYIISTKVISCCDGKIFNLHPSILPKYRGCSSVTWAIINNEQETGFSYHYIDSGCDTGNIILQKPIKIENWDTQLSLFNRVMFHSMLFFDKALEMVVSGFEGIQQTGDSSFYKRGCPYNGVINGNWEIAYIERFIRAMYNPPYPPAIFNGKEIRTLEDYLSVGSIKTND